MFKVVSKTVKDDSILYGVLDTSDGVLEQYTGNQLCKIVKDIGIIIEGVSYNPDTNKYRVVVVSDDSSASRKFNFIPPKVQYKCVSTSINEFKESLVKDMLDDLVSGITDDSLPVYLDRVDDRLGYGDLNIKGTDCSLSVFVNTFAHTGYINIISFIIDLSTKENSLVRGYFLDISDSSKAALFNLLCDSLGFSSDKVDYLDLNNLSSNSSNKTCSKTVSAMDEFYGKYMDNVEEFLAKAIILGYEIIDVTTLCCHKVYFALKEENAILYIPDDVVRISPKSREIVERSQYHKVLMRITGTLKVSGGKNLKSSPFMFYNCKAQILDLSGFNTSNVTDMQGMFFECKAQTLDLSNFNTSNVTDMSNMFLLCRAETLDLSSFNTSNVTTMHDMFYECHAEVIDLSSFDTSKVTDAYGMFCNRKAHIIIGGETLE